MRSKIAIYLAGSIKKGHEKSNESYWSDADLQCIRQNLSDFEVFFLNPAFRTDDLSDQRSVFGRDMTQVFSSDFVFVDARDRRGLGVGAEMMWAKINNIPVITWAPKGSHYHKAHTTVLDVPVTNFIHPFVESLSDKIVENLIDGARWIQEMVSNPSVEIRGVEHINSLMEYYQKTQLPKDKPMKELISASEALRKRMERTPPSLKAAGAIR